MFGQHASFIVPSYVASVVVLLGVFIWLRVQYAARKRELAELEKAGIKRRSAENT